MSPTATASGLERDLSLIRRRGWVFAPFLLVGIALAVVAGTLGGDSTASASLELETLVYGVPAGADRGLRVFEAQAMTRDRAFQDMVRQEAGEPGLDFGRYSISLIAPAVSEGLSQGTLNVSISDSDQDVAARLRDAFVEVFTREFLEEDGLFRQRHVERQRGVAETIEREFNVRHDELRALAEQSGVDNYEQLIAVGGENSPVDELNMQIADLSRELAEVEGALAVVSGGVPEGVAAAIASSTLGQPVSGSDAAGALTAWRDALVEAMGRLQERHLAISGAGLDADLRQALDEVRALARLRETAYERVADANVAAASAQTSVETSTSLAGPRELSLPALVAVAVASAIVLGLIAIFALEWFSGLRAAEDD